MIRPGFKGLSVAEAVFPDAQKYPGVGLQGTLRPNGANGVEQGNGEVAQFGLRVVVAELFLNKLPEAAAELGIAVEGLHRICPFWVGWILQLRKYMKQQLVDIGLLLSQHGEHLEANGGMVVVGTQQILELASAYRREKKSLVLLGQLLKFQGEPGFLDIEGSAIGLELMACKQQIQQPVVWFSRLANGQIKQKALIQRCPAYGHLHGKLVALHAELFNGLGLVVVKVFCPFAAGVVPKHHALAGQSTIEAVVDAGGGCRRSRHQISS